MLKLGNFKIKWKLVLWSAALIMGLFFAYNLLQYFVMSAWMVHHEELAIQDKMNEVQHYYQKERHLPSEQQQLVEDKEFLQGINEKSEMIIVYDQNDKPLITVSQTDKKWKKLVSENGIVRKHVGEDRLLIDKKVISTPRFKGSIEIVRNLESFDSLLDQFGAVMLLTLLGAIVVSVVGGLFLSNQLLKPLQDISMTLARIKKFGLKERVVVKDNRDEISQLAIHFNELMDQLELSFNKQKQFVEDASHELRTPLAALQGNLSMLNRWGKDNPAVLEKSLNSSLNEVERLNHLVKNLLELTRFDSEAEQEESTEPINPGPIIERVIEKFETIYPEFQLDTYGLENKEHILVGENHLEQLLFILIDNAIKYSVEWKKVAIHLLPGNNDVRLVIQDWGIGIPEDEIPLVLNRFYRVDKSRNRKKGGHGIGLSIAKKIVDKYDGQLTITSDLDIGTKVEVMFPNANSR
ncbi:HAMP domain-containing sensor histidine kinase [Falsibacillus albus]|uniref:Signal transduction histidine-protein kinase ArlS n=1 Tax=Falsibacillus albus TaxID=2478915 RepID=A0A3L7JJY5_9BACI|nr:HAMP domain-containing histidine kinase [Falsibacillus albus]RLQ91087.1 sensor histidine kinase [Falsibacillus albus]